MEISPRATSPGGPNLPLRMASSAHWDRAFQLSLHSTSPDPGHRTPRTLRSVKRCLHTMVDDLPPSHWADKHPKLARLIASVTLLVFAAVTLAWWGFLAWLIWRVI